MSFDGVKAASVPQLKCWTDTIMHTIDTNHPQTIADSIQKRGKFTDVEVICGGLWRATIFMSSIRADRHNKGLNSLCGRQPPSSSASQQREKQTNDNKSSLLISALERNGLALLQDGFFPCQESIAALQVGNISYAMIIYQALKIATIFVSYTPLLN